MALYSPYLGEVSSIRLHSFAGANWKWSSHGCLLGSTPYREQVFADAGNVVLLPVVIIPVQAFADSAHFDVFMHKP